MTQKTITLNLDSADRVQTFNKQELLQIDAYESANNLLNKAALLVQDINNKNQNQSWSQNPAKSLERIHNAIFIDGERGTGKTAFMLNLEQMYKSEQNHQANGLYFSQPIDPTLLNVKEDFLNIIIGQIHAEVEAKPNQLSDDYYQALSTVAEALESESTAKNHVGIDKILSFKSSLSLERNLFDYFTAATSALNANAIVLLIDDVDMSLDMAFNVLEVIRKYLACPYIIPVVSGDKNQYNALMYKHFVEKLAINSKQPKEDETEKAKDLAHKYMQKLFPEHGQIRLKTFGELLKQHDITVKYNEQNLAYRELYSRIESIIWAGATNCETDWTDFTPKITREAIQLNSKLANLSQDIKDILFGESENLPKLYNNINFLKALMEYCYANNQRLLAHTIATSIELHTIRNSQTWQPLRNIGVFDIYQHYTTSETSYFKVNSVDQLDSTLFGDADIKAQKTFLANLPNIMMSYPRVEPFSGKLKIAKGKLSDFDESNENLLFALYTHHDYFNSDRTGHLVFFGKIIEIIISSIIQPISEPTLNKIVYQPPYHSFFHYFANKPALNDDNESSQDEDSEEIKQALDVDFKQLVRSINKWRAQIGHCHFSAIQLYNFMFKYFENILLLKNLKNIQNVSFDEIHQRIKLITLNACASFEIGEAGLSKQSIAIGQSFDLKSTEKYSVTYLKNIKPLLGKESLTHHINKHPLWKIDGLDWINLNGGYEQIDPMNPPAKISRLYKLTEDQERELLVSMYKHEIEIDDVLIVSIISRITKDKESQEYKPFFKKASTIKQSTFGKLFAVAKRAGLDHYLTDWLNSPDE